MLHFPQRANFLSDSSGAAGSSWSHQRSDGVKKKHSKCDVNPKQFTKRGSKTGLQLFSLCCSER